MSEQRLKAGLIERLAEKAAPPKGTLVERASSLLPPTPPAPPAGPAAAAPGRAAADPDAAAPPAASAVPLPRAPAPAAAPRERRRASIDLKRLASEGFIIPGGRRTQLSEDFRHIKRPLLLNAQGGGPDSAGRRFIMITGARPGEGKTFTAVNLALSMASEPDLHVMLIDADVLKPSIPQALGLIADRGLIDILEGDRCSVPDVLIRIDNIPNLSVLPAGRPTSRTTELLASQRMAQFAAEISRRYSDRIIIVDTPPLVLTSEPSALALHAGQIVIVVEAEETSERLLREALELLPSLEHVSLVLNKARTGRAGSYSSDYAYYATQQTASAPGS